MTMDPDDLTFGADENCVLQFLRNFPNEFISVMEIARRAGSRQDYLANPRWAHTPLNQLLEWKMVETDGCGKFRLVSPRSNAHNTPKKFIDPKFREILEQSDRNFDLSAYA